MVICFSIDAVQYLVIRVHLLNSMQPKIIIMLIKIDNHYFESSTEMESHPLEQIVSIVNAFLISYNMHSHAYMFIPVFLQTSFASAN